MNRADSDEPSDEPSEQTGAEGHPAAGAPKPEPDEDGEDLAPDSEYAQYDQYDQYDHYDQYEPYTEPEDDEPLRRQLAHFAFVREEYDREVRLSFRDVPAGQIAATFHSAGALLISVTGERALSQAAQPQSGTTGLEVIPEASPPLSGRRRRRHRTPPEPGTEDMLGTPSRPSRHTGELTMRYFFSLRETVYTVNIASPTGVVESIAAIYPLAGQCERDLQSRLEVIFRPPASRQAE